METTKHPLDSLLKEQLGNYSPEVPANLYPKIKSNLAAQQSGSVISKAAVIFKNASIVLKSSIIFSLTVPAIAAYFMLQNKQVDSNPGIVLEPSKASISEAVTLPEPMSSLTPKKAILPKIKPQNIKKAVAAEPVQTTQFQAEIGNKLESTSEQKVVQPVFKAQEITEKETPIAEPLETKSTWNGIEQTIETKSTEQLVIPNAFSPNSDGINDEFEINLSATLFYRLRIYHLNGTLLFETDKPSHHWKGTLQESGIQVENGSYRYILEYQLKEQPKPSMAAGYIYLNR